MILALSIGLAVLLIWAILATIAYRRSARKARYLNGQLFQVEKFRLTSNRFRVFLSNFGPQGVPKEWVHPMDALFKLLGQDFVVVCEQVRSEIARDLGFHLRISKGVETEESRKLAQQLESAAHIIRVARLRQPAV